MKVINEELTVSKIEKDAFRYTGIDVKAIEDRIEIQMEYYIESLEEVKEIRKADRDEELTKAELKVYRKMTSKLSWLANSTHLYLSYTALAMSKKNNSAKIKDLRDVSRVLKKAKERFLRMKFSMIGIQEMT